MDQYSLANFLMLTGLDAPRLADLQAAGLLPGQDRFSRADMAAVMMVLLLEELGAGDRLAIGAAMAARPALEALFTARGAALRALPIVALVDASELEPDPSIVLVHSDMAIGDALEKVLDRRCLVVDLLELAHGVVLDLKTFPDIGDAAHSVPAAAATAFARDPS